MANIKKSTSSRIDAFLDKVTATADKVVAMANLPKWMMKNLRLDGRKYSFKDHECHLAIARDTHPHQTTIKCSQVGLTELSLRITAALAGVSRSRIIYVLPSARFSEKVSTDRFLPIIKESPTLLAMVHPEAKSSSMRKLGTTTVYFQGASGTSQAISIPATHLIVDEQNFCDPVVLGQFNSRLRHNPEDPATRLKGSKRGFSTPTIPKYGVSEDYRQSDQKGYQVKCKKCATWQLPSYYNDYVIPGYDNKIALFEASDLANRRYRVHEAYVKCQKCGTDLWESLMDPTHRQWVAATPSVIDLSGYAIAPIDVPAFNSVPSVFLQLKGYTIQDHRNFVMGLHHEDKHNSFLESIFSQSEKSIVIPLADAGGMTLSNIRIGVDIGKTSHIIVGKRVSEKKMAVVLAATISIKSGKTLAEMIQVYIDAFNPDCLVLDAGPDFSTPQILLDNNSYGQVFGCEYTRSTAKAFSNTEAKEDIGIVKADRSGTLSDLMKAHNEGEIIYPDPDEDDETDVLRSHLNTTKKTTLQGEFGDVISFPKPTDPDHYCHALNYMMIADTLVEGEYLEGEGAGMAPSVTSLRLGSNHEIQETSSLPEFFYTR